MPQPKPQPEPSGLPWHQLVLEFGFQIYPADALTQQNIIRTLDGFTHGTHIVIPVTPPGFSRFSLSVFDKPYIHPYFRVLSLGLGDLENLHDQRRITVDPRIQSILPLHDREHNRDLVSLSVHLQETTSTRFLVDMYRVGKNLLSSIVCLFAGTNIRTNLRNSYNSVIATCGSVKSLWTDFCNSLYTPEKVERVATNRLFELYGEEAALRWAFRRHVEMSLATLCLCIVAYKAAVTICFSGFLQQVGRQNTHSHFLNETVLGCLTCAVWAPYTLNQWKWIEATLIHEWDVGKSLLTDPTSAQFRHKLYVDHFADRENFENLKGIQTPPASIKAVRVNQQPRNLHTDVKESDRLLKKAWDLKEKADYWQEAARPATDARVLQAYRDALNIMSEVEPLTCVCQKDPCECHDLHTKLQELATDALAKERENRTHLSSISYVIVAGDSCAARCCRCCELKACRRSKRTDALLPEPVVWMIEFVAVLMFVLTLAALNGLLLFMEYMWFNIIPLCESRFYVDYWEKNVATYQLWPKCFGGIGTDPWSVDNVSAGKPEWLWRGLVILILDIVNAFLVDVVYTDLMGVNLAEFCVWLRNYRLKEEREARLVALRFHFEIIGYFAIYLMQAFAFIPFGQEINTYLYRRFSPDEAKNIVTLNVTIPGTSMGQQHRTEPLWTSVTAESSEFFRVWTATRAPMVVLKDRIVPLFIATALIANIIRVLIPAVVMLRRRRKTVGRDRCWRTCYATSGFGRKCRGCTHTCCVQPVLIWFYVRNTCCFWRTPKRADREPWRRKTDCALSWEALKRIDTVYALDQDTYDFASQISHYIENEISKTQGSRDISVKVMRCRNLCPAIAGSDGEVRCQLTLDRSRSRAGVQNWRKSTRFVSQDTLTPTWSDGNMFTFTVPVTDDEGEESATILESLHLVFPTPGVKLPNIASTLELMLQLLKSLGYYRYRCVANARTPFCRSDKHCHEHCHEHCHKHLVRTGSLQARTCWAKSIWTGQRLEPVQRPI